MSQSACGRSRRSRRAFLRRAGGAALGLAGMAPGGCAEREARPEGEQRGAPAPKSNTFAKVVEVRSDECWNGDGLNEEVLAAMLEAATGALFDVSRAAAGWAALFDERDTVGLKVNCLAGPLLSSRPELARTIARALGGAGVAENAVIAWDRSDEELLRAGYEINAGGEGLRCLGTDHERLGLDDELVVSGKAGGYLSTILTRQTTATINVPVLKDHGIVGVAGSLKNNYGCIHNPSKGHGNCGDPYAADLNLLPQIKDKQRLVVCDATTLQYHGGPGFKAQWAERYGALIVATDPVALDTVCASLIEEWRANNGMPSLAEVERPPKHIATAGTPKYGLGVADLAKIRFVRKTV